MSVRSLTALAVERDRARPGTLAKGGQRGEIAGTPGQEVPQTFVDALTSSIPTEPLAAYTALVGVYAATVAPGTAYLPLRWWAFAGFLAVTAASVLVGYYQKSRRTLDDGTKAAGANPRPAPLLELFAALLAAGAWGLAMPGSPLAGTLSGTVLTLTTSTIVIGGAALIALFATPLTKATNRDPTS